MNPESFFSGDQLAAYRAAQRGEIERIRQAAAAGRIDLNQPGREDMTLLGLAVLAADRPAIISLVRAGANPNQVIPDAGSPAILAISRHFNPPRTEAVAALLDGGYDPNQLLDRGKPYLFFFVDMNHWPGLRLALERGGSIDARRPEGESLLVYVISGGDIAQARALVAAGADVSVRGKFGESALRSVESKLRKISPTARGGWNELLALRQEIMARLPNPEDRRTVFTDEVERKIQANR